MTTTDDLRKRARVAALEWRNPTGDVTRLNISGRWGFIQGVLWHASQQPTREQIARALHKEIVRRVGYGDIDIEVSDSLPGIQFERVLADAVIALLEGASDE